MNASWRLFVLLPGSQVLVQPDKRLQHQQFVAFAFQILNQALTVHRLLPEGLQRLFVLPLPFALPRSTLLEIFHLARPLPGLFSVGTAL